MKRELFALSVIIAMVVIFPATLLGYQSIRSSIAGVRTIDVEARLPDDGGFGPDMIRINRGETVRLRLSAPDVVHGLEIPGLGISISDIYPGRVVEVTFTAAEVGRFAFVCTRWCSANHWRMRGVIEVIDPGDPGALARLPTPEMPLYERLGLNIDAMPELSPQAGQSLDRLSEKSSIVGSKIPEVVLPSELSDPDWLRVNTPAEVFLLVRKDDTYSALSDEDVWSMVARSWRGVATDEVLERGASLFARDCAACHGEKGRGDGPLGRDLPGLQKMMPMMKQGPANFGDIRRMAAVSDAFLQGKVLRGGMGTGMPEFGSLYSTDDQWAVVALVRSFMMGRPAGGLSP